MSIEQIEVEGMTKEEVRKSLLSILENIENMVSPTDTNRLLNDVEKDVLKMGIVHQLGMNSIDYKEMVRNYLLNNPSSVDEIIKYEENRRKMN